jgi:hypothetical protein
MIPQIAPRVAFRAAGDDFRGARHHDSSTQVAGIRSKVDHPIGSVDDVQIMLDHDHTVAGVGESVKDRQLDPDIVEMKSRGRFVK